MPATQGYRLSEWHEPPFLTGSHTLESTIDTRVFDPDNENDIAQCLLENDERITTYQWVLPEKEVHAIALESAQAIIRARRDRYADNLVAMRFEQAKHERARDGARGRLALVVTLTENLETGAMCVNKSLVPVGRVFG